MFYQMSYQLKWFLVVSFTIFCIMIIWIYQQNTIEEASIPEVIVRGRLYVSVTTEPADLKAKVFIDGEDTNKTTPLLLKLFPGHYLIRVEAEGYKTAEQNVIVKTLRTIKVNFKLEPL